MLLFSSIQYIIRVNWNSEINIKHVWYIFVKVYVFDIQFNMFWRILILTYIPKLYWTAKNEGSSKHFCMHFNYIYFDIWQVLKNKKYLIFKSTCYKISFSIHQKCFSFADIYLFAVRTLSICLKITFGISILDYEHLSIVFNW